MNKKKKMRENMIPIAKPILGEEEIDAVASVLKSGTIAQGTEVNEFERAFTDYIGTKYAIAVSSGTAALYIALLSHAIGRGDEVIVPSFSFISTANSVILTGAKPLFADIQEDFNINHDSILEKITKKTKAIIPVHLYGYPADMDAIQEIASDNNLIVIEDACQAHGAEFNGKKVGSFGTGAFSFYPTKNMTTGEGGMITTSDSMIKEKASMIRNHGSEQRYYHEMFGFNLRMTDIQAAIGLIQLKKLNGFNEKRQKNAAYLSKKLKPLSGLITPTIKNNRTHVFHQYTIRVTQEFGRTRDEVLQLLNKKGIGAEIYYPIPIHKQPYYQKLGYNDHLPITEKMANEVISLPVHPSVSLKDLNFIMEIIGGLQ